MSGYFFDHLRAGERGTFYIDGLTEVKGTIERLGVDYIKVRSGHQIFLIPLKKLLMFAPDTT